MKHSMNKRVKVSLILATLVVVAIVAAFWASRYFPFLPPFVRHRPPDFIIPGDIELYYTVKMVVSSINVTLMTILLITYVSLYKKTKSEFTLGLMIFSIVLLFNTLTSNPLLHWVFGFSAFGLGPFAMLPDLFTLVALVILLYLTFK